MFEGRKSKSKINHSVIQLFNYSVIKKAPSLVLQYFGIMHYSSPRITNCERGG
jgi:hypothetical protein